MLRMGILSSLVGVTKTFLTLLLASQSANIYLLTVLGTVMSNGNLVLNKT